MSTLFSPQTLGSLELKNHVVMSPMTRSRSENNVPGELVATYYGQRAEAGLIVTEGTSPSPNGIGYPRIPGCYSKEQAAGWKLTTKAVHDGGGKIFIQLMHTGRVSHPDNMPAGARVLAPSAITCPGKMYTDKSHSEQPFPEPTAMSAADIESAIEEYVKSCALAIESGFDGVELHGANGYLIDQFLNTASNQRTDEWGGSITNRTRFALEVARRASKQIGAAKVGIRLSPYGVFNGMKPDADMDAMYIELARGLSTLGMAYVHIVDHSSMGAPPVSDHIKQEIHGAFGGKVILSGGYDKDRAEKDLEAKKGDLVAFGRPFISNPKLVTKMKAGTALREPDPSTFYTPGPKGYTDYPID